MATQIPLVLIAGSIKQLPVGDTLSGAVGAVQEPASVFNGGSPEILFDEYGDVVMCNVS